MVAERTERTDALTTLGDLFRSKKRFSESVEAYDAAIARIGSMEPRHWRLLFSRGISLERSKNWPRAEKDFLAALELSPNEPYLLNYLGYSWVDQGIKLKRALGLIERAVKLEPQSGAIVDSLGWALYRMGDYDGAVEKLERAAELEPLDPTVNDHLGDCLLARRSPQRSIVPVASNARTRPGARSGENHKGQDRAGSRRAENRRRGPLILR